MVYPYDAVLKDELTIRPGDVIHVEEQLGDWWRGTVREQCNRIVPPSGYFYKDFIIPCHPESEEDNPQVEAPRDPVGHPVDYNQRSYYITEQPGDELFCIICLELPSNPLHTDCCGHTLCSLCAAETKKSTKSCPQCRESPWRSSSDPRIKRYISGLTAYCSNYEKGCGWKGSISGVNGIGDHLKRQCQFTVMRCERPGCTQRLERRLLKDHVINTCLMRPVQCPCCGVCEVLGERQDSCNTLTYSQLTNTHYKECPQWPMRCPNHCSTEVKLTRSTLQDHLENNCPEQVISCQFKYMCSVRLKKKDMAQHMTDHIYEMKQVSLWLSIIALLLILFFLIFKSYMSGFDICVNLFIFIATFSVAIKILYDIHVAEQTLFRRC